MLKHLKITISGSPRGEKNIELFEQHVIEKIDKIADEVECELYHFAQIHYRFVFTAVNLDIKRVDTLHKQILRLTSSYLDKWIIAIKITYTETEKD